MNSPKKTLMKMYGMILATTHDFTFTHWGNGPLVVYDYYIEPIKIARYTCTKCGAKADSKTLYMMDREECHGSTQHISN